MAYAIQNKQYYLYDYTTRSDHNEYELYAWTKSGLRLVGIHFWFTDQLLVIRECGASCQVKKVRMETVVTTPHRCSSCTG